MNRVFIRLAAVVAALAVAGSAQAAFVLQLQSGALTAFIYDNNVPVGDFLDNNAAGNNIGVTTPVAFAGYTIQTQLGASYAPGLPAVIQQSILNVVNNSGTNPLIVTAYNTMNAAPTGLSSIETRLTVVEATNASATIDTGIDATFYAPVTLGAFGSAINTALAVAPGSYTYSNRATLTIATGGTIDIQTRSVLAQAVPAPPAVMLAALGVPALGLIRRWTRKAPQPAVA